VAGTGVARIGDVETTIANGDVSIVPSGVVYNFRNTGSGMLKLFTTYSPSEHTPGTSAFASADVNHVPKTVPRGTVFNGLFS
jgi:mannose-6-phosphate isomerase-like protein (cupin superfamily)